MACLITDSLLALTPDGSHKPLPRTQVYAVPSAIPFFTKIPPDTTWKELQTPQPTATTDANGVWSFYLPWPSESEPNTATWQIVLPDGSIWQGLVPEGAAGPLSIHDLKQSYGWGLVAGGATSAITAVVGPGFDPTVPQTLLGPLTSAYQTNQHDGPLYTATATPKSVLANNGASGSHLDLTGAGGTTVVAASFIAPTGQGPNDYMGEIVVRMKTGDNWPVGPAVSTALYPDSAGLPDTGAPLQFSPGPYISGPNPPLLSAWNDIYCKEVNDDSTAGTNFVDFHIRIATYDSAPTDINRNLTPGAKYWIVFYLVLQGANTGTIQFQASASGNSAATYDGSAWHAANYTINLTVLGQIPVAIDAYSQNWYGIQGQALITDGVVGLSTWGSGVVGVSKGVGGNFTSTYDIGAQGFSTWSLGGYFTSAHSTGVAGLGIGGISPTIINSYGVYGMAYSSGTPGSGVVGLTHGGVEPSVAHGVYGSTSDQIAVGARIAQNGAGSGQAFMAKSSTAPSFDTTQGQAASGSLYAATVPSAWTGDLINLQLNSLMYFQVSNTGDANTGGAVNSGIRHPAGIQLGWTPTPSQTNGPTIQPVQDPSQTALADIALMLKGKGQGHLYLNYGATAGSNTLIYAGGPTLGATFTGSAITFALATTISAALTVSSGITIAASGLTVTAGGATITAGGLTITAGGITSTGAVSLAGSSSTFQTGTTIQNGSAFGAGVSLGILGAGSTNASNWPLISPQIWTANSPNDANNCGMGISGKGTGILALNYNTTGETRIYAGTTLALQLKNANAELILGASGNKLGFYGTAGSTKLAVTGSRAGNAALASLLSQLAALGLITDSSTA